MTEGSERIWQEFSLANAYNPAQIHRWRLVRDEVQSVSAGAATIVDLGCGSGALLERLAGVGNATKLIGIDLEPRALALAHERLPLAEFHRADLERPDGFELADLAGRADVVVCSEVLEHLEQPRHALALALRLLRPGGALVVTVPAGPMNAFDRSIGHVRHYSVASLSALLADNGFGVSRSYAWGFPFHTAFRMGIGMAPTVVDSFSDSRMSTSKRMLFRLIGALFWLNLRSRHVGRQLVAAAVRPETTT